ncbi:SAV_6107 family HEPN domain-containing protein [Nocardia brasiliensis]|uniref:SAV_6107 family HEPN domain-containing protein n=1 Tax=Nocardia brasiliensis TaxID=37326 RepID=UPI00245564CF|nr:SAV_6107 family HEPN domain-containing protein [Nocardia brasiliensis]
MSRSARALNTAPGPDLDHLRELVNRSSLGTAGAKALQARITPDEVARIRELTTPKWQIEETTDHVLETTRGEALLRRARHQLEQAEQEQDPPERFRTAYLAALRGAGAILAVTGADRAPRSRSRNAWVLIRQTRPDFVTWADFFSSHSELRAALEEGLPRQVETAWADAFVRQTFEFLDDVDELLSVTGGATNDPDRNVGGLWEVPPSHGTCA